MSSAVAAGVAGFLGSLVGSIVLTPRADGSVLVSVKPYKFLYAKTISVGAEPVQILEKNARAFLVKADGGNTDDVFIGDVTVVNGGYQLEKSEAISFNIDNPDAIYVRAKTGSQKIHVIVLGV